MRFLASIAGVVLGILASLGLVQILSQILPEDVDFTIRYGLQPRSVFACVCGRNGDYTHNGYGVRIPREQIEYRGGDPRPSRGVRSESKAGSQTPTAKPGPSAHRAVLSAISWDSRQAHKIFCGPLVALIPPVWLVLIVAAVFQADIALHSHWVGVGDTRGHPGGRGGKHLFGSLLLDRSVASHSRGRNGAAELPGQNIPSGRGGLQDFVFAHWRAAPDVLAVAVRCPQLVDG